MKTAQMEAAKTAALISEAQKSRGPTAPVQIIEHALRDAYKKGQQDAAFGVKMLVCIPLIEENNSHKAAVLSHELIGRLMGQGISEDSFQKAAPAMAAKGKN